MNRLRVVLCTCGVVAIAVTIFLSAQPKLDAQAKPRSATKGAKSDDFAVIHIQNCKVAKADKDKHVSSQVQFVTTDSAVSIVFKESGLMRQGPQVVNPW